MRRLFSRNHGLIALIVMASSIALPGETRSASTYSGQLMTIDLKGDLRDFFQSIAKISGLELRLDPSIKRNVALHIKDVPWDLALDVVLSNSGLSSEGEGKVLRIVPADPRLGQNHVFLGTVTIEGRVTDFQLQNPRTSLELKAPDVDGQMHTWQINWEGADDLTKTGIKPNTFKPGDQLIITGNLTRPNTMHLLAVKRPKDGFSWGDVNVMSSASLDGVMFVSSSSK
jgi:uncharacterized protein DUF6152